MRYDYEQYTQIISAWGMNVGGNYAKECPCVCGKSYAINWLLQLNGKPADERAGTDFQRKENVRAFSIYEHANSINSLAN